MKLEKITEKLGALLEEQNELATMEEIEAILQAEDVDYDPEFDKIQEDKLVTFYNELPVMKVGHYFVIIKASVYEQYCKDLAGELGQCLGDGLDVYLDHEVLAKDMLHGQLNRGAKDGLFLIQQAQTLLEKLDHETEQFETITPVDFDCFLIKID